MPRGRPSRKPTEPQDTIGPTLHINLPLIEVAEAWILDTLMNDTSAGRMIVARLDDRAALVAVGQLDALLTRLRKLGHTPRVMES
jgi:hypothetical protein